MKIGWQIAESCVLHLGMTRKAALKKACRLLERVQLPDPRERLDVYPHQLSGGMRQRVMIALALACSPRILIADEPTTALDVSIQAQILGLLSDLQRQTGTSMILITHDMAVIAENADRIMIMYAGTKVEEGPVDEVLAAPRHPYTYGLIRAVPRLGSSLGNRTPNTLSEIPGVVPLLDQPVQGCPFAPRCELATARCRHEFPTFERITRDHGVACFHNGLVGAA